MDFTKLVIRTLTIVGTIAALFVSIISIQGAIEKRIQSDIETSSLKIINVVNERTSQLVEFQKDDLWDRIQLLELEIQSYHEAGNPVPERLLLHLRSMKERYEEMKQPWSQ